VDQVTPQPKHPAKYTDSIVDELRRVVRDEARILGRRPLLLDPFAGVGRVHRLEDVADTTGVELRPRWAACHARTRVGDATRLPSRWTGRFDVVATSPCYGNRFSDHHDAKDASRRHSYAHDYGEPFDHPSDAGVLRFTSNEYRLLHQRAWRQVHRVLHDGGLFLLNVKNFYQDKELVLLSEWHIGAVSDAGFRYVAGSAIPTPGMRHGRNHEARVDHELVLAFRKVPR
jgi:hypothetical protein